MMAFSGERRKMWVILECSKIETAHPVNYFPGILGKNIKDCPPSKLFLFTSLVSMALVKDYPPYPTVHCLIIIIILQPVNLLWSKSPEIKQFVSKEVKMVGNRPQVSVYESVHGNSSLFKC